MASSTASSASTIPGPMGRSSGQAPPPGLRRRLKLRPPLQAPPRPHTLRIHLQDMGSRATMLQGKSAPPKAGTKQPWPVTAEQGSEAAGTASERDGGVGRRGWPAGDDQLATGRNIRMLTIMHLPMRYAPAIGPGFGFQAGGVVEALERVGREQGGAQAIRVDQGSGSCRGSRIFGRIDAAWRSVSPGRVSRRTTRSARV